MNIFLWGLFGSMFIIPVVALLTEHQRKMAEIRRSDPSGRQIAEIAELRQDLRELKAVVHQIAIAVDRSDPLRAELRSDTDSQLKSQITL